MIHLASRTDSSRNRVRATAVAVALTLGLVAAACSSADDSAPTTAASAATTATDPSASSTATPAGTATSDGSGADASTAPSEATGELTVGLLGSPESLDPNGASSAIAYTVMRPMFDSLVYETTDHEFTPWLATEWTISPDGLTYTFTLRDDVTFHDGTKFDAAAVKANFDHIVDPASSSKYASTLLGTYESSTVVDPTTIEVTLKSPYAPLLEGLSQSFLGFQSPAAITEYGADLGQHPVGTGPFMFESSQTDQEVVLVSNPAYDWGPGALANQGPPKLAKLTFKFVADDATRVGALQSGELDAVEAIPAEQVKALEDDSDFRVNVEDKPGATYAYYLNQLNAPWDQVEARKAFRQSIDVDTILQVVYSGTRDRSWTVLSPQTTAYEASAEDSWTYDPKAAVAAFEGLGYTMGSDGYLTKDGERLTVHMVQMTPNYDKRFEIDTIVQQQLKDVGIDFTIENVDFAPYAAATENGEYDIESFSVVSGSPSILDTIFNSANQPGPDKFTYNVAHFSSSEVDQWAAEAAASTDPAEQAQLYGKIQQALNDQAVPVPIYVLNYTFATKSDVEGIEFDSRSYPLFNSVSVAG